MLNFIKEVCVRLTVPLLPAALLVLAACGDIVTPAPDPSRIPSRNSFMTQRFQSSDEYWASFSEKVPAFAGLYFDQSGDLLVRLTRLEDSSVVVAALGGSGESLLARSPKRGGRARLRFEIADKNFRELFEIKRAVSEV